MGIRARFRRYGAVCGSVARYGCTDGNAVDIRSALDAGCSDNAGDIIDAGRSDDAGCIVDTGRAIGTRRSVHARRVVHSKCTVYARRAINPGSVLKPGCTVDAGSTFVTAELTRPFAISESIVGSATRIEPVFVVSHTVSGLRLLIYPT